MNNDYNNGLGSDQSSSNNNAGNGYDQNGYNQNGYNPPPPNYGYTPPPNYGYNPPPEKHTNGMAVASLVLGIVGFVLSCCCMGVSLICSILAIIFAIVSKNSEPNGQMNGMAIAGLIIGAIGAALGVIVIIFSALGGLSEIRYDMNDFMNEFQNLPYGDFGDM